METTALGNTMMGVLGLNGEATLLVLVLTLFLFGAHRIPLFISGLTQGLKRLRGANREITKPFRLEVRWSGREVGKSLGAGLGKPVADALTHSNRTWEFQDPPALRLRQIRKQMKNSFILWVAQGFGVGRIPIAPGTFGSLVGLIWLAVLLVPGNPWVGLAGMLA